MNRWTQAMGLSVCVCLASVCYGDLVKGDRTVRISAGFGGSSDRYDYQPGEREDVTGGGGAFGGQYLYYVKSSPNIALGADLMSSLNGNRTSDDLLSGCNTTARMKSLVGLVVARLSFPRGLARPYIFGGLGGHNSIQQLTATPRSGQAWSGGGTETRTLVDENKTSLALGGGIGIDIYPRENFFFGAELRSIWLAGLTTDDTAPLRAAGFTAHTHTGLSQQNLLFHAGIKF